VAARRSKPRRGVRRWSAEVTARSDALDLEDKVFLMEPRAMARSLRRSALRSTRRKAEPFRSAMSMLIFYENRAGRNLSPTRRRALARAKDELRAIFHRDEGRRPRRNRSARPRARAGVRRAR
jgi:hypothetical protein